MHVVVLVKILSSPDAKPCGASMGVWSGIPTVEDARDMLNLHCHSLLSMIRDCHDCLMHRAKSALRLQGSDLVRK